MTMTANGAITGELQLGQREHSISCPAWRGSIQHKVTVYQQHYRAESTTGKDGFMPGGFSDNGVL